MTATATTTYTHGAFVWRELFTKDVAAAKAFYGGLFGWSFEERPMGPDWSYTLASWKGQQIAGMMDAANMPDGGEGIDAHWACYVSVPDVDAVASLAVAEGATICMEAHDIPGVGRFAMIQDPQGASINLFKDASGDPSADTPPGPGEFCWENLSSPDPKASEAFYTKVLGWVTSKMGEDTTIFERVGANGPEGLASMGQAEPGSHPAWTPFVQVASVKASAAKCLELGGQVFVEFMEISPEVGAFGVIQDPTGATIFTFEGPAA